MSIVAPGVLGRDGIDATLDGHIVAEGINLVCVFGGWLVENAERRLGPARSVSRADARNAGVAVGNARAVVWRSNVLLNLE